MIKEKSFFLFGFTLIELLIVLSIIAILATLAYPRYYFYTARVRRGEAKVALLDLAMRLEDYYADHNSYEGASLKSLRMQQEVAGGFYRLAIDFVSDNNYKLSAIFLKECKSKDDYCRVLTLDRDGNKGGW